MRMRIMMHTSHMSRAYQRSIKFLLCSMLFFSFSFGALTYLGSEFEHFLEFEHILIFDIPKSTNQINRQWHNGKTSLIRIEPYTLH